MSFRNYIGTVCARYAFHDSAKQPSDGARFLESVVGCHYLLNQLRHNAHTELARLPAVHHLGEFLLLGVLRVFLGLPGSIGISQQHTTASKR